MVQQFELLVMAVVLSERRSVEVCFRILTVCTGNICRSPAAQVLLGQMLSEDVHVESAGTGALVGQSIDPSMFALLETMLTGDGRDVAEKFSARQVTRDIVKRTDLVLTMTREQRSYIVAMAPAAIRLTFTLREFGRIMSGFMEHPDLFTTSAQSDALDRRLSHLISSAGRYRSYFPPSSPKDDDVIDPFRGGRQIFKESMRQMVPPIRKMAAIASIEG